MVFGPVHSIRYPILTRENAPIATRHYKSQIYTIYSILLQFLKDCFVNFLEIIEANKLKQQTCWCICTVVLSFRAAPEPIFWSVGDAVGASDFQSRSRTKKLRFRNTALFFIYTHL